MTDQYLRQQADVNPDAPFLVTREGSLTYGEVDELVSRRARDLGDRSDDQVVVRTAIDVESVVEILAATRSGATAVLISATLAEDLAAEIQIVLCPVRAQRDVMDPFHPCCHTERGTSVARHTPRCTARDHKAAVVKSRDGVRSSAV